jgi:hypothetical protein
LLNDANKALVAMIKAARADKGSIPRYRRTNRFGNRPDWLRKIEAVQKGLQTKSNDFFKGIAEASQAEQQMKVG